MKFHASTISRVSQFRNKAPFSFHSSSKLNSNHKKRCNFGIAFDIDGVILRGRVPVGGSPQALRRLYGDSGELIVPYLFLTNGGGIPETKRAKELSELLGVNIMASQVVQGHSPFRNLLKKFENELIIATGKGDPASVMSEYGFKKVLSLEEFASYFDSIDPVSPYKRWTTMPQSDRKEPAVPRYNVLSERIKAAFVVSDPVDWGRDIQVLCDVLRSGGLPGGANNNQPPLYFAADDLEYQIKRAVLLCCSGSPFFLKYLCPTSFSTACPMVMGYDPPRTFQIHRNLERNWTDLSRMHSCLTLACKSK